MRQTSIDLSRKHPFPTWPAARSTGASAGPRVKLKALSCFHIFQARHCYLRREKPPTTTAHSSANRPSAPAAATQHSPTTSWMHQLKISALFIISFATAALGAPAAVQASTAGVSTMVQPSLTALFLAAVVPVLKVFMLCSIGALLTHKVEIRFSRWLLFGQWGLDELILQQSIHG